MIVYILFRDLLATTHQRLNIHPLSHHFTKLCDIKGIQHDVKKRNTQRRRTRRRDFGREMNVHFGIESDVSSSGHDAHICIHIREESRKKTTTTTDTPTQCNKNDDERHEECERITTPKK